MKKIILTSATILTIALPGFAQYIPTNLSQEFSYELRRKNSRQIKTEKLNEARFISDVIPDYPNNWISKYVSVLISVTHEGKTVSVANADNVINAEQKKILNAADLGTDILVDVKYDYKDPLSKKTEYKKMHTSVTVIPDIEAEYIGGDWLLSNYVKNKLNLRIPELFQLTVKFIVDEKGKVSNARILKGSGYPNTDKLFIEAINKMPRWKPAETSTGVKIKQEFEFVVNSSRGGGC